MGKALRQSKARSNLIYTFAAAAEILRPASMAGLMRGTTSAAVYETAP